MVICLERGADLHTCMSQLMLLPLTVSCFSKIQIGFTFLVPAHLGSPGQRAVKPVCKPRVCLARNTHAVLCSLLAVCKVHISETRSADGSSGDVVGWHKH